MGEIIKELTDNEKLLTEAYKDLVRPSAQPIGTMISLLPRTIRLGLSRWEKWVINGEESLRLTATALSEKVERIPEEKQCEPEPYIAVPAIQQLSYCYDSDVLRNMYATLLASSMNLDLKWSVHPGFVDIIKQLTPDEAKILNHLPKSPHKIIAIADLVHDYGQGIQANVLRNVTIPELYSICDHPENMSSYLDNFERLKLIAIENGKSVTNLSAYESIESLPILQKAKGILLPEGQHYELSKKIFYITDFGASFIKCCIEDNTDQEID